MFQQMKLFHINMLRDFCGKVRFKKAAQNFCSFWPVALKQARPSLKKFFASFFQKRSASLRLNRLRHSAADPRFGQSLPGGGEGAVQVDGAAGILDHRGAEAEFLRVLCRPGDAEIRGEAAEKISVMPREAKNPSSPVRVSGRPRGRRNSCRHRGAALCAGSSRRAGCRGRGAARRRARHDAMGWPERLRAVGHLHGLEGLRAGMVGGEGGVVRRVPVLGQHHGGEFAARGG